MSELINRWFGRAARLPGMLGCGLRYADGTTLSRTWESHLTEEALTELWSRLLGVAHVPDAAAPESQRWTFDKNVVIGASRPDGPTLFILMNRKSEEADPQGVERLVTEFRALRT